MGITIVVPEVVSAVRESTSGPLSVKAKTLLHGLWRSVPPGAVFSLAFCLALVPWTIRNKKVFHLFQPLAPAHGEMPGEFVPRGYLLWLRTWLDDERYIGPLLWSLDASPIKIYDLPDTAFDSDEERDRVEALLEKYSHPSDVQASQGHRSAPVIRVPQTGRENKPPPGATPQPGSTDEAPTQGDEEGKSDEEDTEQSDQENS